LGAAPYLTEFLDILTTDVELRRINIIAHSMGNRVLVAALEDYAADYLRTHPDAKIEFRIILAAADVDRDIFDQVTGKLETLKANVTIYTSDDDLALKVSKIVNGVPRLGDTDKNKSYIREKDGFETVDATPVATELFGLGHGYYSSNPFILGDILCALAETPPVDRALASRNYDDIATAPEFFLTNPEIEPDFAECSLVRNTKPNNDPNIGFGYGMGSGRGVGGGGTSGGGGSSVGGLGSASTPPPPPPPPPPTSLPVNASTVLFFDVAISEMSEVQKAKVKDLVSVRQRIRRVEISGFADKSGNASFNMQLSQTRAQGVADWLAELGVDPNVIIVTAFGEKNGQVDTQDGTTEPLNRRVEVLIEYW